MSGYPPAPQRLTREQFQRAVNHALELQEEALRCSEAGAYYAACLIGACAVEAVLLANVLAFEPEMQVAGTWQPSKKQPPENWSLRDLLAFHVEHGWITREAVANLPYALDESVALVNWVRDVVAHPGRLIREAHSFEINEGTASAVHTLLQVVFDETNKIYDPEAGYSQEGHDPLS